MNGFSSYWAQIEPAIRDNLPSQVLAKAVLARLCTRAGVKIEREKKHASPDEPRPETIERRKAKIQATWDDETRERRWTDPDFNGLARMLTLNHRHESREAQQRRKTERRSEERKRKSEAE